MRYISGGIGQRAADFIKQSITEPAPETLPNTQEVVEGTTASLEEITDSVLQHHHPQLDRDDIEEDTDLKEVDSEEEHDFGYGDGADSDAADHDTSSKEGEVHEEDDYDDFADL
jgi:hypothetical protein